MEVKLAIASALVHYD